MWLAEVYQLRIPRSHIIPPDAILPIAVGTEYVQIEAPIVRSLKLHENSVCRAKVHSNADKWEFVEIIEIDRMYCNCKCC